MLLLMSTQVWRRRKLSSIKIRISSHKILPAFVQKTHVICNLDCIFARLATKLSSMKIQFFTTLSLILCVFVFSCQKELQPIDPLQPGTGDSTNNPQPGTGDTTGNGSDTNSVSSYYPLTTGSWWKYKDSTSGVITMSTLASTTKMINGILYKAAIYTSTIQNDTGWVAAPSPNYYLSQKGVSPSGLTYDLTFHYLNDTASVGYNWKYIAGSGNGFTAYITTTIIAKKLTVTVAGKTYTNVIQTHLDFSYDIFGSIMKFGDYDYFIAKGVGIVKIKSDISMSGAPVLKTSSDLIDYSIK